MPVNSNLHHLVNSVKLNPKRKLFLEKLLLFFKLNTKHLGIFHIIYFSVLSCSVPTFQGLQEDILSKLADVLEEVKSLY